MSGPFVEEMRTLHQWHEGDLNNTQCSFSLSIWKTLPWASKIKEKKGICVVSLWKRYAPFLSLYILPNNSLGIRVDPPQVFYPCGFAYPHLRCASWEQNINAQGGKVFESIFLPSCNMGPSAQNEDTEKANSLGVLYNSNLPPLTPTYLYRKELSWMEMGLFHATYGREKEKITWNFPVLISLLLGGRVI